MFLFFFWGGVGWSGWGWGVFVCFFVFFLGGGGGQGGCERRIEVFVKIQKKNWGGGGVMVDVNEEF